MIKMIAGGIGAVLLVCAGAATVIGVFAITFRLGELANQWTGTDWVGGFVYMSPVEIPLLILIFAAGVHAVADD